jgi:hypothetical protein
MQLFTLGFGVVVGVGWMLMVSEWLTRAGTLGAILAFAAGRGGEPAMSSGS